jgi:hypothetical protein
MLLHLSVSLLALLMRYHAMLRSITCEQVKNIAVYWLSTYLKMFNETKAITSAAFIARTTWRGPPQKVYTPFLHFIQLSCRSLSLLHTGIVYRSQVLEASRLSFCFHRLHWWRQWSCNFPFKQNLSCRPVNFCVHFPVTWSTWLHHFPRLNSNL